MVPIIGQPQVHNWSLAFNATCVCGRPMLFSGRVGDGVACEDPACPVVLVLTGLPQPGPDGKHLAFPLTLKLKGQAITDALLDGK
jgi:hypothetical protein